MSWLILAVTLIVLLFGLVVFFGAPYLPTMSKQVDTALDLLDLAPGQKLLELGSGDGRVLLAAASRGLLVTGYELNPILVAISWLRTRHYRRQVTIKFGNYWGARWPETDGIFVFLLDKYMEKLDKNIVQQYPGKKIKLVSFAFQIPTRKPRQVRDGLYLYEY
jgi:hypothetical protein